MKFRIVFKNNEYYGQEWTTYGWKDMVSCASYEGCVDSVERIIREYDLDPDNPHGQPLEPIKEWNFE